MQSTFMSVMLFIFKSMLYVLFLLDIQYTIIVHEWVLIMLTQINIK